MSRGGLRGALAAWLGFTLPSALALVAFAYGVTRIGGVAGSGWVHGLAVVAVAVVAQAVLGMARTLCPDRPRAAVAILAAVVTLLWPAALSQVLVISAAALVGWRILPGVAMSAPRPPAVPFGKRPAAACLGAFVALLVVLPVLTQASGDRSIALVDGFYRAGSLVFGGGHVVLPLLRAEVVPPGWVTDQEFAAGYGANQAVPGPLFAFSAYLGALAGGPGGAALALVAVFLPAALLVLGALPFWDALRTLTSFQAALRGINASVVGILLAALYDPIWTSAILAPEDLALALAAFGLLVLWKAPPWLVVLLCASGGMGLTYV